MNHSPPLLNRDLSQLYSVENLICYSVGIILNERYEKESNPFFQIIIDYKNYKNYKN